MGHYAQFRSCGSREAAARAAFAPRAEQASTEVEAKYRIPLFWLAGFSPEDLVMVRDREVEAGEAPASWSVPCAPTHEYLARARARRAAILSVVPAPLGDCYDEWLRFVERRFRPYVMIETRDLLSMTDYEEGSLRLRGALRALQAADGATRLADTAALDWFSTFVDAFHERPRGATADDTALHWRSWLSGDAWISDGDETRHIWPTRPASGEVALAASLPEPAEPGTPEAAEAALTDLVRTGVHPDGVRDRLRLAARQFVGDVPAGVDAPTRGLRKWIAGASELLEVVRSLSLGVVLTLIGLLFTWGGAVSRPIYWVAVAIGVGALIAGGWLLRAAWRGRRRVRAIMRA